MSWVGFEPTIPVFERANIVHALARAATVTGQSPIYYNLHYKFRIINFVVEFFVRDVYLCMCVYIYIPAYTVSKQK
jgi:hypothetical protein